MQNGTYTYEGLSKDSVDRLTDKVQAINDRATKKGWNGRISLSVSEPKSVRRELYGFLVTEDRYKVTLTAVAPCYEGWSLLAVSIVDSATGARYVYPSPGIEVNRNEFEPIGACDHCGANRYRNATYLVKNTETGETMQVGSTCVKDFLGWHVSFAFVTEKEVTDELNDLLDGVKKSETYPVDLVIAVAWAVTKSFGYAPTSATDSTKAIVLNVLRKNHDLKEELQDLASEASRKVEQIREWLSKQHGSEYIVNLQEAVASGDVTMKSIGLVVSLPYAFERSETKRIERERESSGITNEWFGDVKERVTLSVQILKIHIFENYFGQTTLYTLADDVGRRFVWFSSNNLNLGGVGDTVKIKGTIKEHSTYRDVKQTVLTRVKKL